MGVMRDSKSPLPQGSEYATSKLALMTFANTFQHHLSAYIRPDKAPNNARVLLVDPGLCRTPGTRRWLSLGSLWGLGVYIALWPVWWLFLKSAEAGAESVLMALQDPVFSAGLVSTEAMDAESKLGVSTRSAGVGRVKMIRECGEVRIDRPEVFDEDVGRELWAFSERQIIALEREGVAKRRAVAERERMGKVVEVEAEDGVGVVSGTEPKKSGVRRSGK